MDSPIALIKAEREKKGWTVAKLAEEASVNERTLQNWEQGHRKPKDEDIQKLAKAFGKKLTYKLTRL